MVVWGREGSRWFGYVVGIVVVGVVVVLLGLLQLAMEWLWLVVVCLRQV